jgi:hypothetical protein
MTATLPGLLDGHAPITLQYLFRDALDQFEGWDGFEPEPDVLFHRDVIPISDAFDAMKGCTDIVPANLVADITARLNKPWEGDGPFDEMTFSTAARVMSVLVRKKLLEQQRPLRRQSQLSQLNS